MGQILNSLFDKTLFFFDIDGTIMLGHKALPGASDFLDKLKQRGKKVYILSNNSSYRSDERVQILKNAGFHISNENYLSSTKAMIHFLQENKIKYAYIIASDDVRKEFSENGIDHSENNPEVVILTYDRTLNYDKIVSGAKYILSGIPYYATHLDLVCPTEDGYIPDAGSFAAMFKVATGKDPDMVFGKPDPNMILGIIQDEGVELRNAVMFGDRVYTDIQMAKNAGIISVGVLTGEATKLDLEAYNPDFIIESLEKLNRMME